MDAALASDAMSELSELGRTAVFYATRFGWAVFPVYWPTRSAAGPECACGRAECGSVAKHPIVSRGVSDATIHVRTITDWWSRWPDANIGVATGAASGIDVLDIDPRHEGDNELFALEHKFGRLPDTVQSLTGGGGFHYLFVHARDSSLKNRSGLVPGIDFKTTGGYIVAPPSLHASGNRYAWEASSLPGETLIASMPAWLTDVVARRSAARAEKTVTSELIDKGQRNDTLFRLACRLRRLGKEEGEILVALRQENTSRCRPPLGDREVEAVAASAAKYEPGAALVRERVLKTPAARALELGRGHALPTGIEPLDHLTRGGPRTGRIVFLGAPPGAGKTTLATQIVHEFARNGVFVGVLSCDEDADGVLIRWGQQIGLPREALEQGDDPARRRLAEYLKGIRLVMVADGSDEMGVEAAAQQLRHIAGSNASVMLIDSVQTVPATTTSVDGPRARVDQVVRELKRAARVHGHLVITTTEFARGAYRSNRSADRIDDLAAAKESGAVEYAADVYVVLRERKGQDVVDASVVKNRLGDKGGFALQLDRERALFSVMDAINELPKPAAVEIVRKVIHENPGISGFEAVRQRARIGKDAVRTALNELGDEVVNLGQRNRPRLFLRTDVPAETEVPPAVLENEVPAEPVERAS